ncbi:MAG: M64 family metallopeptidase [Bacteriovoracaceae bacterium]|nr:M64 family metallopeptidase [Bacteriovoracaceae bacterium]
MKLAILPLLFSTLAYAVPYKMVIITDPETKARAEEFKEYIKSKSPFNKLGDQFAVEISEMSADEMACSNDQPDAPRIISCNTSKLWNRKSQLGGHIAAAFTSKGTGGAGGSIAVASKDYPLSTMLHEMLHTYGLDDEYTYSESERKVYCKPPKLGLNTAIIKTSPPYADKKEALDKHAERIPWSGKILEETPITHGSGLGTTEDDKLKDTIALFEGGNCTGTADFDKTIYRPYLNSIMKTLSNDTIYPLYEERMISQMESARGEKFTFNTVTPTQESATVDCEPGKQEKVIPQTNKDLESSIQGIYDFIFKSK